MNYEYCSHPMTTASDISLQKVSDTKYSLFLLSHNDHTAPNIVKNTNCKMHGMTLAPLKSRSNLVQKATKFITDPGHHPAKEIAKPGQGQCVGICSSYPYSTLSVKTNTKAKT